MEHITSILNLPGPRGDSLRHHYKYISHRYKKFPFASLDNPKLGIPSARALAHAKRYARIDFDRLDPLSLDNEITCTIRKVSENLDLHTTRARAADTTTVLTSEAYRSTLQAHPYKHLIRRMANLLILLWKAGAFQWKDIVFRSAHTLVLKPLKELARHLQSTSLRYAHSALKALLTTDLLALPLKLHVDTQIPDT